MTPVVPRRHVVKKSEPGKIILCMKLSIIIPVLNEARWIQQTLQALQFYRGEGLEIIVVDGESMDDTVQLASPLADIVLNSKPGRAKQMNCGASNAQGKHLLFLHADTILSEDAFFSLQTSLSQGVVWGRFDIRLSGNHPPLRMVESFMNWRSRWTGIATGDQGIFVGTELFKSVGGFPDIALMEDIALSKKLRRIVKPGCLKQKVISSSRRWETNGIFRTILLMWSLRIKYFLGVDPNQLANKYL